MTNKEKYRQAFSAIHASDEFTKELKEMEQYKKTTKRIRFSAVAACLTACILVLSCATVAYAADIGGFRQTVQLWILGEKKDAQVTFDGQGNYDLEYTDENGSIHSQGGGGVALSPDGEETPLSQDELIFHLRNEPDVRYEANGKVTVYWHDQKIDITDKFENNVAYLLLQDSDTTLYLTVKYQNGYAYSPEDFIDPAEFNFDS